MLANITAVKSAPKLSANPIQNIHIHDRLYKEYVHTRINMYDYYEYFRLNTSIHC